MKLQKSENKIIIVTGLSGAGRTTALKILEDIGFEAVDNLPFFLLHSIVESKVKRNLAIGVDICPYNNNNKNYIDISYFNKDVAKNLGAKWDNNKKSWYYLDSLSTENIDKLKDLQL